VVDQATGTQGRVDSQFPGLDPSIELMWRKRSQERIAEKVKPVTIDLPSGMKVIAQRMDLRWLWKHDLIPDPILARVEEMISLIESADPNHVAEEMGKQLEENPEEAFSNWYSVLGTVWQACVVAPQFTYDPDRRDAEEPPYHVDDAEYFDKLYLYQWAQGVDRTVIDFLHEQSEALGELATNQSVRLSPTSTLRVDSRGRFVVSDDGGSGDVPVGDVHPEPNRRARRTRSSTKQKQATHGTGTEVQSTPDSPDVGGSTG